MLLCEIVIAIPTPSKIREERTKLLAESGESIMEAVAESVKWRAYSCTLYFM